MNSLDGVRDKTGASLSPWAIWIRAWTAEENKHGDLLNKYLYLSGRVDMKQIEKTIQYLIGSGMDPKFENNPYNGFIYTSFQERATFISHGNTAKLAKDHGDMKLAQMCGTIAADEKRHEIAYTKVVEKLFETDPDENILSLAAMMKKKIKMPAYLMYDGQDDNLFKHYSAVAQRLGVYCQGLCKHPGIPSGEMECKEAGEWTFRGGPKSSGFCVWIASQDQEIGREIYGEDQKHGCITSTVPFSWIFCRQIGV
ncbi:hypothetical protein LWI29_000880 [Acer saccharum]|uniref:stearoyl-[acyl-carrier-protein] 9-desaturase n=1 Tax=Acer saccharum TaxID=4024 RepID=A0AA39VAF7_ACESA|nr:hypothetical protein LWI29_000880 [Acer saccharum]